MPALLGAVRPGHGVHPSCSKQEHRQAAGLGQLTPKERRAQARGLRRGEHLRGLRFKGLTSLLKEEREKSESNAD